MKLSSARHVQVTLQFMFKTFMVLRAEFSELQELPNQGRETRSELIKKRDLMKILYGRLLADFKTLCSHIGILL
jgi:hypothetical protein